MRNFENLRQFQVAGSCDGGAFVLHSPTDGEDLLVIASDGGGWDHVSVSRKRRVPNWQEMQHVHRCFFKDEEIAVQFHVPPSQHINCHPYCLHLWRPNDGRTFPQPPTHLIGPSHE